VRKAAGASASEEAESRQFTFSAVFDPSCPQHDVYEKSARATVMSVLEVRVVNVDIEESACSEITRAYSQGYNACVLAYGPTSTGKTYTMEGDEAGAGAGVIPRALADIFHRALVVRIVCSSA
jgi:hypothetical protein